MADLLTTREVQDLLQVDRTTIYRMVEGQQLPAIRVGRQWRFVRAELDRWLAARSASARSVGTAPGLAPALAAPTQAASSASLSELLPTPCCQMIQDVSAELLGVTIVITDMQGRPITRMSNPCGLYAAMMQDADSVARCVQDWERIAGAIPLEPRFSPNDLGLLCARGLIRFGNELKGMVFFGGIAPDAWPPAPDVVAAIAEHFGVPADSLAACIGSVHRLDKQERDRVLSYVQRVADIFSHILEDRGALHARLQAIASLIPIVDKRAEGALRD